MPAAGLLIGPNTHGERTFFSDNWPNKARQWLPVVDHPYDKATERVPGRPPPPTTRWSRTASWSRRPTSAAAGASRTGGSRSPSPPGSTRSGWRASRWSTGRRGAACPIETWVYPQDRDTGFAAFAEPTVAVLEFFADRVGPYSYERLANVQANGVKGGMESATSIFYGDDSVSGPAPGAGTT